MADPPPTNAEWAERNYLSSLAVVVKRLRAMVDRVEQQGGQIDMYRGRDYVWAAHNAVHEVMWGLANAGLDSLVSTAGECQRLHTADDLAASDG